MSSRKNVSDLVSAAGWLGSFVGELVPALRERGMSDEEIHAFVTSGGKASIGKIADMLTVDIKQQPKIMEKKNLGGIDSFHIGVKQKRQGENFEFTGLDLFHQNCLNGKIVRKSRSEDSWTLGCDMCGSRFEVSLPAIAEMIKTAVDGQIRTMDSAEIFVRDKGNKRNPDFKSLVVSQIGSSRS